MLMLKEIKNLKGRSNVIENIDSVPSNVQSSRQEALLYVFEDNEAVIKMIIKGRSPTMRHVSRTHRVALDWLFDRINLGPQNPNQIHRHQKPGDPPHPIQLNSTSFSPGARNSFAALLIRFDSVFQ